jgi:predicted nuclease of predicted toxin-antitoxin system
MRFLVDENLPRDLVDIAHDHGIEAAWVRDIMPGARDLLIVERLRSQPEILVTCDVRFANMIFNLTSAGELLSGVVLIREQGLKAIRQGWRQYLGEWRGAQEGVVVISGGRIRRHRLRKTSHGL